MNTRVPKEGLEQTVHASKVNRLLDVDVLVRNHEPNARYLHVIIVHSLPNLQYRGANGKWQRAHAAREFPWHGIGINGDNIKHGGSEPCMLAEAMQNVAWHAAHTVAQDFHPCRRANTVFEPLPSTVCKFLDVELAVPLLPASLPSINTIQCNR